MPHVAYLCPDPAMWRMWDNQIIEIVPMEECLDCSLTRTDRRCSFDFQQLQARREDTYNESFSPSRFNGCDKELYFKQAYDFWTDPALGGAKVRGTAVHSKLETSDPRVVSECRVTRVLAGAVDHLGEPCLISVQPDIIYPSLQQISDTKTWKYLPRKNGKAVEQAVKTENRLQLSVGAWAWKDPLLAVYRDGTVVENPDPITITSGQIMLSDGSLILRQSGIALVKDAVLERWMRMRVLAINRARLGEEPPLPPVFKRWRCDKGCPVRYLCPITPEEVKLKDGWNSERESRRGDGPPKHAVRRSERGLPVSGTGGPPTKGTHRLRGGKEVGAHSSRRPADGAPND